MIAVVVSGLTVASGCATNLGPKSIPNARFNYTEAIANSWTEQLLLNLVRTRYRDTVQFLEVSSVITQYTLEGSASASLGVVDAGSTVTDYGAGAGVAFTERPTITYTPLQGDVFAQRVLSPIPAETLILLAQSGWSTELLMLCCAQQVNALQNARAASVGMADFVPRFADFNRAAHLLRELQAAGQVDMRLEIAPDDEDATVLYLQRQPPGEWQGELDEVRQLLGLPSDRNRFQIVSRYSGDPDEIAIVGRSLVGVMFFLSQAVEVPEEHVASGKVTVVEDQHGRTIDWAAITGDILHVYSDSSPPADAYARVFYRGYWYYIDDSDVGSKTTFGLLSYLFSLQSAGAAGKSPLLTVSTGR
jgi:hypothetical protein